MLTKTGVEISPQNVHHNTLSAIKCKCDLNAQDLNKENRGLKLKIMPVKGCCPPADSQRPYTHVCGLCCSSSRLDERRINLPRHRFASKRIMGNVVLKSGISVEKSIIIINIHIISIYSKV